MTVTRNGFTVQVPESVNLTTFDFKGIAFKVWKPTVPAFRWLVTELDKIEPVTEIGWDGGYAHRKIAGTNVWSEHAAATAIDWNASQHLRTGNPRQGWSAQQYHDIVTLLRTGKGQYFRWGADFNNPDPMHFELRNRAQWASPLNPFTHPYLSYTVKAGDTLTSIADRYRTTVKVIHDLNRSTIGANPDYIAPGMILRIPR